MSVPFYLGVFGRGFIICNGKLARPLNIQMSSTWVYAFIPLQDIKFLNGNEGMLMLGVTRIPEERPGLLAKLVGYD